jgi:glucose 1-dehydrogenase
MSDDPARLDGRVALVTGAGGDIGRAVTLELVRLGARVACVGRTRAPLEAIAAAVGAAGGRAHALPADVRSDDECRDAVAAAVRLFGGLDILVNNAGISSHGTAVDGTREEFDDVLATDLAGPFSLTRHAARRLPAGGSVVNVGSIMGTSSIRGLTAYSAAKGGLLQLTRQSALDLAPRGIRVNLVAPGFIAGEMFERSHSAARRRRIRALHPLGRLGTPQDVAGAVAFLASAQAAFITGVALVVDGGLTLQLGIDAELEA